ncbi:uncharacterized protein GGS22DRAFT_150736 [Annulohypoxylon maeteangense]|uniref:uncharacterized protein n=1 Tax=Annulohypoxylon maeteangense TaxID=1927788 RepID=UPI002007D7A6|nr:uncharacterized protein GGS22DRAFT_150736 [Annulohypoxylon maeteangense]KAI0890381.1 hypothetical protein GGS22DRAFT_150736 [Annulohypoxylon maeteangense]
MSRDSAVSRTSLSRPATGTSTRPTQTIPILMLNGRIMTEEEMFQHGNPKIPRSISRPPARRGNDTPQADASRSSAKPPAKPPIFGSTSHKKGMNEAMAQLNLSHNTKKVNSGPTTTPRQSLDRKPPNPAHGAEFQRTHAARSNRQAPSQPGQQGPTDLTTIPSPSQIPALLKQTDEECRYASRNTHYWTCDGERDLWQQLLVAKLVLAKHQRLNETQGSMLRSIRLFSRIERVEMRYRLRQIRNSQGKAREKAEKAAKAREKKMRKLEEEKARKQEEAMEVVMKLLNSRQRRGDDYGWFGAMSVRGNWRDLPR